MEPYIGQIMLFAFDYAPEGWAICDGSLLTITGNDALYSLIGTTYGGDGVANFALPDLRGRVPIHAGQGPGLGAYVLAQKGGSETVTLTSQQLPQHSHALLAAASTAGQSATPGPATTFGTTSGINLFAPAAGAASATLGAQLVPSPGGSNPHENMMPTLVANYCIALQGIFPTQN